MSIVTPVNAAHAMLLSLVLPIAGIFLIIGAIRMMGLCVAAVVIVGLGPQLLQWAYDAASQVRLPQVRSGAR